MSISFLFTIVPFFHGSNRYLDATYVTGERDADPYALLLDFGFILLNGLLFLAAALALGSQEITPRTSFGPFGDSQQFFYGLLAAMFLINCFWLFSVHRYTRDRLTAPGEKTDLPASLAWTVLDLSTAIALVAVSFGVPVGLPIAVALALLFVVFSSVRRVTKFRTHVSPRTRQDLIAAALTFFASVVAYFAANQVRGDVNGSEIVLVAICVGRTLWDYKLAWYFYYPPI
jgi:hypothetical protein